MKILKIAAGVIILIAVVLWSVLATTRYAHPDNSMLGNLLPSLMPLLTLPTSLIIASIFAFYPMNNMNYGKKLEKMTYILSIIFGSIIIVAVSAILIATQYLN